MVNGPCDDHPSRVHKGGVDCNLTNKGEPVVRSDLGGESETTRLSVGWGGVVTSVLSGAI